MTQYPSELNNTDLVERFNRRDIEALGNVYHLLYHNLFYYASKLYEGTQVYSGDIIHDAFLSLWNSSRNDFKTLMDIKGYLLVSIKNIRKNLSIHTKYVEQYAERQALADDRFKTDVIEADIFTLFHQALKLLPDDSAEILELFFQGWKADEIAEKLGKTKKTIYNKKSEALSELKRKMPKDSILLLLPFLV